MEDRVTPPLDLEPLEAWAPPEAPVEMPYQVLERQAPRRKTWIELLRQMAARRAPHE
jgi:hypothetical protein